MPVPGALHHRDEAAPEASNGKATQARRRAGSEEWGQAVLRDVVAGPPQRLLRMFLNAALGCRFEAPLWLLVLLGQT